eukprot:CAMPEP_0174272322 /NCGR_PEP_ID=MMETSP0439-20130205/50853_1 /TAXON_ID=0 /ORGANISM="Stereomyxa ramosa, Strain Chinc5" /LENGTH=197 /DNA_ID=CAMNT_0015362807 /DNA_START=66 /DNA_END=659 /DNA_ORIENTATION=-
MNVTQIKVVIVGDGAVGKTSFLTAACCGYVPSEYTPTVFENYSKNVMLGGKLYNLSFYDTAGQEEYDKIRPLSYKLTNVFLICFCVSSRTSLKNVTQKWVPEVTHHCPTGTKILIGTKSDLKQNDDTGQMISYEEGKTISEEIEAAGFFECSAYDLEGVEELVKEIIICFNAHKANYPAQGGGVSAASDKKSCCVLF